MGSTRRPLGGNKGQRKGKEHHEGNVTLNTESIRNNEVEILDVEDEHHLDKSTLRTSETKDGTAEKEREIYVENNASPVEGIDSTHMSSLCSSDFQASTAESISGIFEEQTLTELCAETLENPGFVEVLPVRRDTEPHLEIQTQNITFESTTNEEETTEENVHDVSVLVKATEVIEDTITVKSNVTNDSDFLQNYTPLDINLEVLKVSENINVENVSVLTDSGLLLRYVDTVCSRETDTIPEKTEISINSDDSHRQYIILKLNPIAHKRKIGSTRRPLGGNKEKRKGGEESKESSGDNEGVAEEKDTECSEKQDQNNVVDHNMAQEIINGSDNEERVGNVAPHHDTGLQLSEDQEGMVHFVRDNTAFISCSDPVFSDAVLMEGAEMYASSVLTTVLVSEDIACGMKIVGNAGEQTFPDSLDKSNDSLLSEIERVLNKTSQSSLNIDYNLIINYPNDLVNTLVETSHPIRVPENAETQDDKGLSLQSSKTCIEPNSPGRQRKMGSTLKIAENLETSEQEIITPKKGLEAAEEPTVYNITESKGSKENLGVPSALTSSCQLEESGKPVVQERTSPSPKRKFGSRRVNKCNRDHGGLATSERRDELEEEDEPILNTPVETSHPIRVQENAEPQDDKDKGLSLQSSKTCIEPNSPGRQIKMGSALKIADILETSEQEIISPKKGLEAAEEPTVHNITESKESKENLGLPSALTSSCQLEESGNPVVQERTSPSPKRKFGSRRVNQCNRGLGGLAASVKRNELEEEDDKPYSSEVQDSLPRDDLMVCDPSLSLRPDQSDFQSVSECSNMEARNEAAKSVPKNKDVSTKEGTGAGLVSLDQIIKAGQHDISPGSKQTVDRILKKSTKQETEAVQFNVVMLGNSCVGKTSFIRRFHEGQFSPDYCSTIGVDTCAQTVELHDRSVKLHIWDTAGQERFHSITTQVFHKADGLLLMYEITSSKSFISVRDWITKVQERAAEDVIMMLLGNKNDCVEREVQIQEGEDLAREYKMNFMECSASTGDNVSESMRTLAQLLVQRKRHKEEHTALKREQPQKKSGCC
ncbi:uncharacterized protein rab44 [Xyrauchen texanus]|uniref:uncharacterized protein rab44 n=1 Tax=Xyrauchen texanus TaxID=154827 RepID=UPI00224266DB|nr:uncharacterized protein rab44 [Xyrauchen texanus]